MMAVKAKSDIIMWLTPGLHRVPFFVCIFMQITSDPMRSTKLIFDLKVVSGGFSFGTTYLRLLVLLQRTCSYLKIPYMRDPYRFTDFNQGCLKFYDLFERTATCALL